MSNYPPTPAFGGGFVLSRPPFPVPKQNVTAKMRTKQSGSVPTAHEALRLPSSEKIASVPSVGSRDTNGFNTSVAEGADGDREEGEISDVEMENGELRSRKIDLHSVHQVNDTANKKYDNSNGKFETSSYQAFPGSVGPRKAKSLTAQISALNLTEQPWAVNHPSYLAIAPGTGYQPLSTAHGVFHAHLTSDSKMAPNCIPHRNSTSPSNSPHSQQQMEEIRKKAQAAVLNLLPLKLTFKDFVDEGINPHILRKVFERIGLPIPPEEVVPVADARIGLHHQRVALEGEKKQGVVLERGQAQEDGNKEWEKAEEERKRKEKDEREQEREAKRLILQEKLQKLKEKEEQKMRDIETKRREEQERKEREEREKKQQEEAIALKKKEEEMLQAQAARKKEQELEELKAKKRIMQKKFEEMSSNLPSKPSPPAIPVPAYTSNISPLSSLPSLTFGPATPAPPGTIPGLLLSGMDIGSEDFASNMTPPTGIEVSQNCIPISPDVINHTDSRSLARKKRPVAADFDSEPSILSHQHKRRFGSFKEGPFIFELTEDEDEDAELDEPRIVDSQKPQSSIHVAARISKSPPSMNGGVKSAGRNGNSPPARSSSTINGNTDAAKQLYDTEEKIRRLREEIQARQGKKKKTSATATPAPTGVPTRMSTPAEPVPGPNNSTVLPTSSTQLLSSPPPKLSQTEQPTSDIPGLAVNADTNLEPSRVPKSERGVSEEQHKTTSNSMQQQPDAPHVTLSNDSLRSTQHKADEECESISMREEAERLRMLLLSKRKVVELRQAKIPEDLAPKDATPEVSNIVKGPSPSTDLNADINISESDAKVVTISQETSSCTSRQTTNDTPCEIIDTPNPEPVTIPPYETPQIIDQVMSEVVRDRSESPPYEPSLENLLNPSESPPYEPSLGLEEKLPEEALMDIDADAEEGEIIEENMPMDVVRVEDDFVPDCLAATHHFAEIESKVTSKGPSSVSNNETPVVAGTVTNLIKDLSDVPTPDTKVTPHFFTDYQSPLKDFCSYRYHPRYLEMVKGGWRSLTFSNRIDPDKIFCVYEVSGGKCNDSSCGDQHFRQISLSDDEILVELGSVMEGDTETVRNSYRDGLRELITGMRARKVNDFETVAAEISRYRSRFFNDSSRVLRFTKG